MAQQTRLGLYGGPRPIYGSFSGKVEAVADITVGFAGRAAISDGFTHLAGGMSDTAYSKGDIADTSYLLTWLGDNTNYFSGGISDVIYVKTDFNVKGTV